MFSYGGFSPCNKNLQLQIQGVKSHAIQTLRSASFTQGLCFLVFLLLTASVSAYMGAALLEMLVTLTFLGLRATYYHERLTWVNWPCLVGKSLG